MWLYNLITTVPTKNTSKGNCIYIFLTEGRVQFFSAKAALIKSRNTYLKQTYHFNQSVLGLIPTFTILVRITRTSRQRMWKVVRCTPALSCSKKNNSGTAELLVPTLRGLEKAWMKSQPATTSLLFLRNDQYCRQVCCLVPFAYTVQQLACPARPQCISFIEKKESWRRVIRFYPDMKHRSLFWQNNCLECV